MCSAGKVVLWWKLFSLKCLSAIQSCYIKVKIQNATVFCYIYRRLLNFTKYAIYSGTKNIKYLEIEETESTKIL